MLAAATVSADEKASTNPLTGRFVRMEADFSHLS